jgi:gas vesicle protein
LGAEIRIGALGGNRELSHSRRWSGLVDNLLKENKAMAENQGGADNKLVYFLIGAGIGAITALIFAPKAGSELRSEFADATRKGLDYTRDTGGQVGERASDLIARGKAAVSDLTDRGKELINRQKTQVAAAVDADTPYRKAEQSDQGKVSAAVEETTTNTN